MRSKVLRVIVRVLLPVVLMGIALVSAPAVRGYWQNVHRIMSEAAFDRIDAEAKVLQRLGLSPFDVHALPPKDILDPFPLAVKGTARQFVSQGSHDEDAPLRVLNHFYDPVTGDGYIGSPAPEWALEHGDNDFNLKATKDMLLEALTQKGRLARKEAWGGFFLRLGHLVHLVQDMAQPQHVRDDLHFHPGSSRLLGDVLFTGYSRYEFYTGERPETLTYDGYETVKLPQYRDYWDDEESEREQGLAQATAFHFVSQDTNFDSSRYPGSRPPRPTVGQLGPREDVPVSYYRIVTVSPPSFALVTETVKVHDVTYDFRDGYTGAAVNNPRLTALSVLNSKRPTLIDADSRFTLTDRNFDAHAEILVPRAVGYSAGLIDHLLRGRIRISPPPDKIYSIVDQSKMDTRDKGFTKVKLRLQNTTLDIEVRSKGGTKVVPQPIGRGKLWAVAKYRRSRCYEINLSGEPSEDTLSSGLMPNGCTLGEFIGDEPDISISRTCEIDSTLKDCDIDSLGSATPRDFVFDFGADPIPINARDVSIQIVFVGELGDEKDAVIVSTRDISEPTYVGVLNMMDFVLIDGVFYTPEEIELSTPLQDLIVSRVTQVNDRDEAKAWVAKQPIEDIKIHLGGASKPIATKDSLAPLSHVRVAVLADQAPGIEFPETQGPLEAKVNYRFASDLFGNLSEGTGSTLLARVRRDSLSSSTALISPLLQFRGIHAWQILWLARRIGTATPSDLELARLHDLFLPPLVDVQIAP